MKSHTSKNKKAKIIYEGKSNSKKSKVVIPIISVAVLFLAILIVGLLSQWTFYLSSDAAGSGVILNDSVLVYVNDVPIKQFQLDAQWNSIPIQYKVNLTRDVVLDEMVKEELLIQEAKKKNITVSDADVNNFILSQLNKSGMTLDSYKASLVSQGTSYDVVKSMYLRQLIIASLFQSESNPDDIVVSDADIQNYYLAHKSDFFQNEKVVVRHILIPITNMSNESVAKAEAQDLFDKIQADKSLFCDFVTNFSADPGSVDNCGKYTFGKGVMVPEFENASFDMKDGEYRIVKTSFGFHIINKISSIPAGVLGLDDELVELPGTTVSQVVRQIVGEQKAKSVFDAYVQDLTKNATISYETAI